MCLSWCYIIIEFVILLLLLWCDYVSFLSFFKMNCATRNTLPAQKKQHWCSHLSICSWRSIQNPLPSYGCPLCQIMTNHDLNTMLFFNTMLNCMLSIDVLLTHRAINIYICSLTIILQYMWAHPHTPEKCLE